MKKESLNIQVLQKKVLHLWRADKASARELGKALVATRDAMRGTHGDFTRWYRSHQMDENRVNYCIRLVEGKVKRTAASIPASPTAEIEKKITETIRRTYRLVKNPLAKEQLCGMFHAVVLDLIEGFEQAYGVFDTANQPPELERAMNDFNAGLNRVVDLLYRAPKEKAA